MESLLPRARMRAPGLDVRKSRPARLVCRDTVEAKILALQSRKRDLAEAILSQDVNLSRDKSPTNRAHPAG